MANWICPGRRASWFGSLVRNSPLWLPFLSQPLLCSMGTAVWLLIDAVSAFRTEIPQIFGSFPDWNCVFRHRRQRAPDWLCVHWEHCLCKSKSQPLGKEALVVDFLLSSVEDTLILNLFFSAWIFVFLPRAFDILSLWSTLAHPEYVTQIARICTARVTMCIWSCFPSLFVAVFQDPRLYTYRMLCRPAFCSDLCPREAQNYCMWVAKNVIYFMKTASWSYNWVSMTKIT